MKLPEVGVKRPVFTAMVFVAILVFGVVALQMLSKDVLPDIEMPTLTVITVYPGASADEVEQQVTKKLEEYLSGCENLKSITSKSRENVSFITLQFQWNSDLNESSANARDMIEMAKRHLPDGSEDPMIMKINSSMLPVVIYGVNSKESYQGISKIIDDKISNRMKKLPGVGTVMVIGEPTREINIRVNPEQLKAYHLSIMQISQCLTMNNINIPGGNIEVGTEEFAIRVPGEFNAVEEIAHMPLTTFSGKIIRLGDVCQIKDGIKKTDEIIRVANKRSVGLLVQKQSGANSLEVAKVLKKEVKEINKSLPPDVTVTELMDTSELVDASINNLSETIYYAVLFVILIVFLFLRDFRSSMIIILTIPFSLIVAFIYMYFAGYTINIFSLMSLAVAIGLVVDNAIVVLDNITRHIERGVKPRQAAIFATGEMGLAITASTLTIIAVFVPLLFMGGLVGIIFKQLAILTSITLLASLVTSLWLTPMLSSWLLKPVSEMKKNRGKFYNTGEKVFTVIENAYKKGLEWSVRHRWVIITSSLALLVVTLLVSRNLGTDYIPEIDAGDLTIVYQTEVGTNSSETERVGIEIEKILKEEVPELRTFFTVVGQTESGVLSSVGFKEGKNMGTLMAKLTPPEERKRSSKEIAEVIRKRLAKIPEVERFNVSGGSMLETMLLGNYKPVEIKITGNNLDDLNKVADTLKSLLEQKNWLNNIETTADKGKPEILVQVDREKANNMGLNHAMISLQVRQGIYGAESGNFKEAGDEYPIVVQYDSACRNNLTGLQSIMLTTLTGQQVPLSSVATISEGFGPLQIERESQERIVKVMADLNDISLGDAVSQVSGIIKSMDTPENVSLAVGGQATEQADSFSSLLIMFIVGILLVYMIMAAQFESFKDPLIIMFTIPLSIIGVLWAFEIAGITLSIVTFVGLIMLIGIDVNNGIILVDYTNLMRKRGHHLLEATAEAGRLRLRPVLMTSLIAILGFIPMATSSGVGSEIWSPLGITCIGGLLVSKLFTMFLIPTLYVSFNRKTLKHENDLLHV